MGIPIGKLALYTAAGGIHPRRVLPVMFDAGTNNKALLNDEFYLGMQHPRLKGEEYFSLLDEAICALKARWPEALIQFEDFSSEYASTILQTYRKTHLCFNDDIQGTGAVTLAGVLCGLRKRGLEPADIKNQRIVVCGAGSAGLGVATTLLQGMVVNGLSTEQAQKNFWVLDQFGLMNASRGNLTKAQTFFARSSSEDSEFPDKMSLLDVIKKVKPTILLGLTATRGVFTEECVKEMAKHVDRPILFPLSNPSRCVIVFFF
jgi:malate dehydrogenase (oxaloacetate-decarboxylating)(NADP+)